ncbi:TrmH family RNA methyltransferase [Dongia mobilis]|jgi:tRNA (cytidine/uridine-2'-O-)-methyltransferase|uniref:tRNA (cytidine(34)-2'-O)-methyltransferase n=1 Tax=Dongia sp. TaxID=1977262 RepID=UPI0026EB97F0
MRLVLFEPDIPQNTGTLLRLAACWNLAVDVILPCGFVFDDRRMKRAGMDYLAEVELHRHASWTAYQAWRAENPLLAGRLLLLSTKAASPYHDFAYRSDDSVMVGRESSGVPDSVHAAADHRLVIPLRPGMRSLNVAIAAAIVTAEALRQTGFSDLS